MQPIPCGCAPFCKPIHNYVHVNGFTGIVIYRSSSSRRSSSSIVIYVVDTVDVVVAVAIVARRSAPSFCTSPVLGYRSLQAGNVHRISSKRHGVFGTFTRFLILALLFFQHSVNSGSNRYREA